MYAYGSDAGPVPARRGKHASYSGEPHQALIMTADMLGLPMSDCVARLAGHHQEVRDEEDDDDEDDELSSEEAAHGAVWVGMDEELAGEGASW